MILVANLGRNAKLLPKLTDGPCKAVRFLSKYFSSIFICGFHAPLDISARPDTNNVSANFADGMLIEHEAKL